MAKLLGIDLGTTFSAMATIDATGRPKIVHNDEGQNITPSCVEINGKDIIVGEEARKGLGVLKNVVGRFKREMGESKKYEIDGKEFTPTDLSSFVLKKLHQDAQQAIGDIEEAVVTVPANFSNEAREATMEAAKKAGLNVKYIINEPTAAALYYASKEEISQGEYAVFDLGGGTFDISIIKVDNMDVEVIVSNGVSKLGGDDFDKLIADYVKKIYTENSGKKTTYTDNNAEEDKKSLSKRKQCDANGITDYDIEITRDNLEELLSSHVAQMSMLCESTLSEAKLEMEDLKGVLLVGGSTRMPIIKKTVEKIFGMKPISTANVDEVVALGAAVYAGYKANQDGTVDLTAAQKNALDKINLSEITNSFFGTLAVGKGPGGIQQKVNAILIKKNEKIPCSVTEIFTTIHDGQVAINCDVTESKENTTDPRFVKIVSDEQLELPPDRPAGQEIEVTFSYNENQIMQCSFVDLSSKVRKDIELKMSNESSSSNSIEDIEEFLVE